MFSATAISAVASNDSESDRLFDLSQLPLTELAKMYAVGEITIDELTYCREVAAKLKKFDDWSADILGD